MRKTILALVALATAAPAAAQEESLDFALTGGVGVGPAYPGSDDYEVGPDVGFTFGALNLGPIDAGNGTWERSAPGFALGGAFRFIGERDSGDHAELAGLDDIDAAVELGLSLTYRQPYWQVFGEVRQGLGGHHGVTGTLGADMILRPAPRWRITAGPRLALGDDEYAGTYFGVTAAEAGRSAFAAYDADGGVLGAGVEVEARYRMNENWALEGAVSYDRLTNDAADSPITRNGSRDQWGASLGISRQFNLRF